MLSKHRPYSLIPIAQSGDRFTNFAPYVPSINNRGIIAFQATTSSGGSGVFTSDGSSISTLVDSLTSPFQEICSHPDIADDHSCCFYAKLKSGQPGVFLGRDNQTELIAESFGPLGPTMHADSGIAYRTGDSHSESSIQLWNRRRTITIARSGAEFKSFQGLPVIQKSGLVAFRADLRSGGHGIYIGDGSEPRKIAQTGGEFSTLASFPTINDSNQVAFCATRPSGDSGAFIASDGHIKTIAESGTIFESFRGALINNSGTTIFYATPVGGTLGIYSGPDPTRDCILAIGTPLLGSVVTEFALNPVSFNDAGQLAIRISLKDLRQLIIRADPVS